MQELAKQAIYEADASEHFILSTYETVAGIISLEHKEQIVDLLLSDQEPNKVVKQIAKLNIYIDNFKYNPNKVIEDEGQIERKLFFERILYMTRHQYKNDKSVQLIQQIEGFLDKRIQQLLDIANQELRRIDLNVEAKINERKVLWKETKAVDIQQLIFEEFQSQQFLEIQYEKIKHNEVRVKDEIKQLWQGVANKIAIFYQPMEVSSSRHQFQILNRFQDFFGSNNSLKAYYYWGLSDVSMNDQIIRYDYTLSFSEIRDFKPGNWMNSNALTMFGEFLMERQLFKYKKNQNDLKFAVVYNQFDRIKENLAFSKIQIVRDYNLDEKVQLLDIFKVFVIPLFVGGDHWVGVTVNLSLDQKQRRSIIISNSLPHSQRYTEQIKISVEKIQNNFQSMLQELKQPSEFVVKNINVSQENGSDCGFFVSKVMLDAFDGKLDDTKLEKFTWNQQDVSDLRKNMLYTFFMIGNHVKFPDHEFLDFPLIDKILKNQIRFPTNEDLKKDPYKAFLCDA